MQVDVPRMLAALGLVDARKKGQEWWAACPHPNHPEKEPSWSILDLPGVEKHGYHHCFGCEWGGGPIELASTVIGCTTAGAVDWIREKKLLLHLPPPLAVNLKVLPNERPSFRLPLGLGGGAVECWPSPIKKYVLSRGITPEQSTRWRLMYATDGRLAGRVVFPIFDELGKLQSYTARAFDGREPRYLDPDVGEHPDPAAMFGAAMWGGRRDYVVVTEGAINALACERAGALCVAALGGSSGITHEQLGYIATFELIVLATDPDKAGDRVASEIRQSLGRWTTVERIALPSGKDAAEVPARDLWESIRDARRAYLEAKGRKVGRLEAHPPPAPASSESARTTDPDRPRVRRRLRAR